MSHASKVMLKILQASTSIKIVFKSDPFFKPHSLLQWTTFCQNSGGTRDQIANFCWIIKKAREFQKNIYFCFIDCAKALTVWITINCGEFWEMGTPDHLTCLLRNRYVGQEATVRTGHGTTDWFQIRKGLHQGCILSSCLFNLYAEYIMRNAGLDEAQAGTRFLGEISITSDMQMIPLLWQKINKN